MKAQVEVRDYTIWTKHIHGSELLRSQLEALAPGSVVSLRINGNEGTWLKMNASTATGHPTPGLRPVGDARAFWGELYRRLKPNGGGLVEIELMGAGKDSSAPAAAPHWEQAPDADRDAAWEAFKALTKAGWRSDRPYGPRDELYERETK